MQLPYIDRFMLNVSSSSIIPGQDRRGRKRPAGHRHRFRRLHLPEGRREDRYPVKVDLWKRTQRLARRTAAESQLRRRRLAWRCFGRARAPGVVAGHRPATKSTWRCSTASAHHSADTVLPESPLFKPEYAKAWIDHDPRPGQRAARRGRTATSATTTASACCPDGRPAEIIDRNGRARARWKPTCSNSSPTTGARSASRCSSAPRSATFSAAVRWAGEIMMSIWSGIDNGVATADMNPGQLAPTTDDQLQWPLWGIALPVARQAGRGAGPAGSGRAARAARDAGGDPPTWRSAPQIWHQMLALYTDQVFSIGIVNAHAAAGRAHVAAAERSRGGPLRLRSDLLFRRLHAGYILAGGRAAKRCCVISSGASP